MFNSARCFAYHFLCPVLHVMRRIVITPGKNNYAEYVDEKIDQLYVSSYSMYNIPDISDFSLNILV